MRDEIGFLKAQLAAQAGQEPVAQIEGIDEYGPRLDWFKHWANVGVGSKLYATPPAPAITNGPAMEALHAEITSVREKKLVQAALEAAAKTVEDESMGDEIFVENATFAIRAIDPQTILDTTTKGQQQ